MNRSSLAYSFSKRSSVEGKNHSILLPTNNHDLTPFFLQDAEMRQHVTEEAKLKKQISELEEKVATSMAKISSLELQPVIDMPLVHFFQNLSFNVL